MSTGKEKDMKLSFLTGGGAILASFILRKVVKVDTGINIKTPSEAVKAFLVIAGVGVAITEVTHGIVDHFGADL